MLGAAEMQRLKNVVKNMTSAQSELVDPIKVEKMYYNMCVFRAYEDSKIR